MRESDAITGVAQPVAGRLVFWKERPENDDGKWMFSANNSPAAVNLQAGFWKVRNGDHLVVLNKDKPEQTLWEGTIHYQSHRQVGYPAGKFQKGVDAQTWLKWFSHGYPAILTPGIDAEKFKTERSFDRILKAAHDLPARYRRQLADALEKQLPLLIKPGEGQVYEGVLEDFFEQGSEAHGWLLFRDEDPAHPEIKDYYRLVGIDEGDYLEIFDAAGKTLWSGVIEYDTASGETRDIRLERGNIISVTWLQAGVEPDHWVEFFSSGYRARLTKPAQSGKPAGENHAETE